MQFVIQAFKRSNCSSVFLQIRFIWFSKFFTYLISHVISWKWHRKWTSRRLNWWSHDSGVWHILYVSFGRSPLSNRTVQFRIWSASVEPDCPIRIWTSTFKSDRSVSYLIVQIRIGLSSYERDRLLSNLTVQFRTWSILVETYRPLSNLPVHFRNWSSTIDVSLAIVCCSVWPS